MMTVRKHGFTLFEVLVTLIVIVIIAATGFFTIGLGKESRAIDRGAEMLHGMVRAARAQALMNGVNARLIIHADSSNPEYFLRRMGVMIEDPENQNYWIAVERAATLPAGVFVVPVSGDVTFPTGWPEGLKSVYQKTNTTADGYSVFRYEYPKTASVSEGSGDSWIAIQFAPNGRLSTVNWGGGGGTVPTNNQILLGLGNWSDGKVEFRDRDSVRGVAFKISGSTFLTDETGLIDDET